MNKKKGYSYMKTIDELTEEMYRRVENEKIENMLTDIIECAIVATIIFILGFVVGCFLLT